MPDLSDFWASGGVLTSPLWAVPSHQRQEYAERQARNRAIRDAYARKVPVVAIAAAHGLSAAHVYAIVGRGGKE
jgi:hypothetical protein